MKKIFIFAVMAMLLASCTKEQQKEIVNVTFGTTLASSVVDLNKSSIAESSLRYLEVIEDGVVILHIDKQADWDGQVTIPLVTGSHTLHFVAHNGEGFQTQGLSNISFAKVKDVHIGLSNVNVTRDMVTSNVTLYRSVYQLVVNILDEVQQQASELRIKIDPYRKGCELSDTYPQRNNGSQGVEEWHTFPLTSLVGTSNNSFYLYGFTENQQFGNTHRVTIQSVNTFGSTIFDQSIDVSLRANYRTTLKGNVWAINTGWNVTIDENFEGETTYNF